MNTANTSAETWNRRRERLHRAVHPSEVSRNSKKDSLVPESITTPELTEEIQGRTPLLPARPLHRHQDRLRPRPGPGPAAAPDLPQDDAETNGQFGPPVGGVQPGPAQEREQVGAMRPQVLGQALVGRVHLGREDQVGQMAL